MRAEFAYVGVIGLISSSLVRSSSASDEAHWQLGSERFWALQCVLHSVKATPQRRQHRIRTFCVRLCDGCYWLIRAAHIWSENNQLASECIAQCKMPTVVFYLKRTTASADDIKTASGMRYTKLPNAFVYRKKYSEQCTCRPPTWEYSPQAVSCSIR